MTQLERKEQIKKLKLFAQFLCFLPGLRSLNCPKKQFLQFSADLSKKPKDHIPGREHGNQINDSIFSSTFSTLTACNCSFLNLKIIKIHFHAFPFFLSILVCKIPQYLPKSYRSGQLVILFQKVDILRLLKMYIRFCLPATAKYPFFQAAAQMK